jgi:hypothetical protein
MIIAVILLFILVACLAFMEKEQQIKDVWLLGGAGILLFLLAGFRDGAAVYDYEEYVRIYHTGAKGVEISFVAIAWFVRTLLCDNVLFLFLIYALLGVAIKLTAIKQLSTFCMFSLLVYISNCYIYHELTTIRAGVAAGFLLLCIDPIYTRDWKKFLLFSFLAILFHYSALVILPLWFLKQERINTIVYASLIPVAYIIYFLNINIAGAIVPLIPIEHIQAKFSAYQLKQQMEIGSFDTINVFNRVFLVQCLIYYLLLFKNEWILSQNKYACLIIKIQGVALASFLLLARMPVFAWRVSQLIGIVEIISIPLLIYVIKPRWGAKSCVIAIAAGLMLIDIFYSGLIK